MDSFIGDIDEKEILKLDFSEIQHCFKVMRKNQGDIIRVINGKGNVWKAEISSNTKENGELNLISEIDESEKNLSYKFHLAVSPTKSADRIEWLLEKAIETGIHSFSLIYTQRTERKRFNIERLNKIAISALKQSGQLHLPEINEFKFNDFIENCSSKTKFIASCVEQSNIHKKESLKTHSDLCVLIGPEGDFTEDEYAKAIVEGFQPITLGAQRFRTETAALMSVMAKFSYDS